MARFFSITIPDGRVQEWESVRCAAEKVVGAMEGVESVVVTLTAEKQPRVSSHVHRDVAPKRRADLLPVKMPIEGVRHVIAIASGKGGGQIYNGH